MFKYTKFLLLLLLICNCSRSGLPDTTSNTDRSLIPAVEQKVNLYVDLLQEQRLGPDGFINYKTCDSANASGILGAAIPGLVNLPAARAADGSWRRRSLALPDCYFSTPEELGALGGSGSSISRDMLTGIMWWIWKNNRLDLAIDMMEYARSHNYIMGSGDPARVLLMPNLTKLLADIIYQLSNKEVDYLSERLLLVPVYSARLADYEAHIQMWQILLDGEVNGGLRPSEFNVIRAQYERRSDNPLFAAANARWISGDFTRALRDLLDPRWPDDRLPERSEYCTDIWIATDNPAELLPCTESSLARFHPSGWEVVVIYKLVIADRL